MICLRPMQVYSIMVLIICIAIINLRPIASAETPGDVNGDGVINDSDAHLIVNNIIGRDVLTSPSLNRADANQDNRHDVADVVWDVSTSGGITIMLPGNVPLTLVHIPAGSFRMGSSITERSRGSDEGPVHTVNIAYDFYMGKTEVTQSQWLALMGSWPGTAPSTIYGLGDNYPAYYISWNDAKDFITALNTHTTNTGQGPLTVRLPSEAEWEYACRGGTQTRFFFGDSVLCDDSSQDCAAGTLPGKRSDYMWYWFNCKGDANGAYGSKPVATKLSNQFGLYDMSGNVMEWCEDDYVSDYINAPFDGSARVLSPRASDRVLRSGFWGYGASYCRSADRNVSTPTYQYLYNGFRLAAVR